jgi:hypothetical protein
MFGFLVKMYNAPEFPRVYGYLVALACIIGYGSSSIFYYKAGRHYERIMK